MVAWLFAQGLERLWLSTDPGTRAQRFYEAAGWRFSGTVEWGEAGYELFRPRPQMPMMTLPIDTPSLRLRHLVVEDAARMMELNGEPSTRRWLPSHVYEDASVATARMCYLISCYASPGDPRHGPIVLAVEHIASGTLLGHVGFSPFEGEVEVSYAIAEQWRGRGYGCEALLHACKWAAESFDLPGILGLTESENKPSRRTLERAAFVHVEDTRMRFQGSQQPVSRYLWRRSWSPG
jgi:RimJ/RimL family protein N-acetyltransferase